MPKVVLDWKTAEGFMFDAFTSVGVPAEDAKIVTDVVLESDRRGIESHGCNRFKPFYIDRIKKGIQQPVTNFEIVKDTPTTAVVDGHDGMGQVIGYKAMSLAIEKAARFGVADGDLLMTHWYEEMGQYKTLATRLSLSDRD